MKKIKAILSALLILIVSISIGGAWHYCGGHLAQFKLTIGDDQSSCDMQSCQLSPSLHDAESVIYDSCCKSVFLQIQTDKYQASSKPDYPCAETLIFSNQFATSYASSSTNYTSKLKSSYFFKHQPTNPFEVDLDIVQTYLL